MKLVDAIKYALGYNDESLAKLQLAAHKQYKEYYIRKKNGGLRAIYHPTPKVKSIQYIIKSLILDDLEISGVAVGYIKNLKSPLKKVADGHKDYSYTLRVDFKDFFSSLTYNDFNLAIENNYSLDLSESDWDIFKNFLFFSKDDQLILPIGAPTSPIVSNIILKTLDFKMLDISKRVDINSFLSRYADDIVFSSNIKGACRAFYDQFTNLIQITESPVLTINEKKTAYMSKAGKRMVNGVVLTPDNEISLGRKYKRFIRKCIHDEISGNLTVMTSNQLAGHLAYIRDVEKKFYTSLFVKYGNIVGNIKVHPNHRN